MLEANTKMCSIFDVSLSGILPGAMDRGIALGKFSSAPKGFQRDAPIYG